LALDALRSCYSTQIKPYSTTDDVVTVDWFFTDAEALPYPHSFGSLNWDTDHCGVEGVGEVWLAPRPYRNGSPVGDAPGTGPPCGTRDQWLHGQPVPPLVPTPLDAGGTPSCCGGAPVAMVPCGACPGGMALATYHLVVAGVTNNSCAECVAAMNGRVVLTGTGCFYHGAPITFCGTGFLATSWQMQMVGGGNVQASLFMGGSGDFATYRGAGWDCLAPITLSLFAVGGPRCSWPPTIILGPGP
jgi:hypothetical protein